MLVIVSMKLMMHTTIDCREEMLHIDLRGPTSTRKLAGCEADSAGGAVTVLQEARTSMDALLVIVLGFFFISLLFSFYWILVKTL